MKVLSERGRCEPSAVPKACATPERPGMTGTARPRYGQNEMPRFAGDNQGGTVEFSALDRLSRAVFCGKEEV